MRPRSDLPGELRSARETAWPVVIRKALHIAAMSAIVALVIWSAILAKTATHTAPLLDISMMPVSGSWDGVEEILPDEPPVSFEALSEVTVVPAVEKPIDPLAFDPDVRWFNGRPVKPAKAIWMTVTAYSPDSRSCGDSADGLTATMHSVYTNGFKLVAADPTLLAYGSMISVAGYDQGQIVPVLDCGGAIKGHHLDVLFPTHEQARAWGVRKIKVTVWKYIDGKAAENPRKVR